MASDYPFSVTSKYLDTEGAELLVTVRAPTVEQFRQHLADAATVFPRAGFANDNGARWTPPTDDPQAPVSITQARRQVEVAEQVQGAHANIREQRAAAQGKGNGQTATQTADQVCPKHGMAKASKYNGLFCPSKDEDTGDYCQWRWPARNGQAAPA